MSQMKGLKRIQQLRDAQLKRQRKGHKLSAAERRRLKYNQREVRE